METTDAIRLLIEKHFVTGCELFQQGMRALMQNDVFGYDTNLQLAAVNGLGGLEQLPKIYLNAFCRDALSDAERAELDGKANFAPLLKTFSKRLRPSLDRAAEDQLVEQLFADKRLRNDAEHHAITPPPLALRQALARLAQLMVVYLPLENGQRRQIEDALRLLDTTGPGKRLSVDETRRLFGAAVRLVDPANFTPASEAEIRQFYEGTPLSWKVILANGDVERDQRSALLVEYAQPSPSTRMLCLCGEPGAGKSTLAWRLALNIADATGQPLLHVRDNQSADIWYELEPGALAWGGPLVVLVDDVFRGAEAVRALRSLSPDLPVTIVATSRSNEIPRHMGLPFTFQREELRQPSAEEKCHVVERFEDAGIALKAARRERLMDAGSWWVMMFEATAGKQSKVVVEDTLARLAVHDPVLYRAMENLCFFGRYDLALPVSLVEALDTDFYRLAARPAAQGLVFFADDQKDALRAPHAQWSTLAVDHYNSNPFRLAENLLAAVDPRSKAAQSFVVDWLSRAAQAGQQEQVIAIVEKNAARIEALVASAGLALLAGGWSALFAQLHLRDLARRCEEDALSREPASDADWVALLGLRLRLRAHDEEMALLDRCLAYLLEHLASRTVLAAYTRYIETRAEAHLHARLYADLDNLAIATPQDSSLRYLQARLTGRYGSPEQKRALAASILDMLHGSRRHWASAGPLLNYLSKNATLDERRALVDHFISQLDTSEAVEARSTLFAFISRSGDAEQKQRLRAATQSWLESNPHEANLRGLYAREMMERGTEEERASVLAALAAWLEEHPSDMIIRQVFLSTLSEHGTAGQKQQYLPVIESWLALPACGSNLRAQFILFLRRNGSYAQKRDCLETTQAWLQERESAKHSEVWLAYLQLLDAAGSGEQCTAFIDQSLGRLKGALDQDYLFESLLGFTLQRGTPEQKQRILDLTESWLRKNQHHNTNVQAKYLHEILHHGDDDRRLRAMEMAAGWVVDNRASMNLWDLYLSLVASTGSPERIAGVIQQARGVLAEKPWESNLRAKLISLVEKRGSPEDLAATIDETCAWLAESPDNTNVRQPYLGLVTKHGSEAQVRAAIEATDAWMIEHASDNDILARFLFLVGYRSFQDAYERAAAFARIWLTNNPHKPPANIMGGYAFVLYRMGRFAEANTWFERAFAIPKNHQYQLQTVYPWSLFEAGRPQEAEHQFKTLLRNPDRFPPKTINTQLGRLYALQGRYPSAIYHFSQVVELDADDPHGYVDLARVLIDAGRPKAAVRYLVAARARLAPEAAGDDLRQQIQELLEKAVPMARLAGL